MNETDSFIYNFIFGLGKFKPLSVSLLGGRFFASYAEIIPTLNEQFITDYKSFLQDQLSTASKFSHISDADSTKFITWIIYFIEY